MRFLIIGEYYKPLIHWLHDDSPVQGVPAVYHLYNFLGNHQKHTFDSFIINYDKSGIKHFQNGSSIRLLLFRFPLYLIWKLLVYCKLYFALNKILKEKHYDVVYGLSTFSSLAAILGRKHQIPSVGRIYGTILTAKVNKKQWWKIYSRHIFEILSIKKSCDLMIATRDGTDFDKVAAQFNPTMPITMLYNGIAPSLRRKLIALLPVRNLDQKKIKICSIARLEPYKRHHLAIEVVENMQPNTTLPVELTIIGSGSLHSKLLRIVEEKGLTNSVRIIPEVAQELMPEVLSNYEYCMILYEGGSLGNTMWESALAGRIICTVDNGSTGDVFLDGKNAIVVPDDKTLVPVLVEKMLLCHVGKHTFLGERARSDVSEIIKPWEDRFESEMELVQTLINQDLE